MNNLPDEYQPIRGLKEEEVIEALLKHFDITREWLMARGRKERDRTHIRQLGILIIRRHVRATSLPQLAELFERDDHTSMIYSLREAKKRLEGKPDFRRDYEKLVAELMSSKDIKTSIIPTGKSIISRHLQFMKNCIWWIQAYNNGDAEYEEADNALDGLIRHCQDIKSSLQDTVIRHY